MCYVNVSRGRAHLEVVVSDHVGKDTEHEKNATECLPFGPRRTQLLRDEVRHKRVAFEACLVRLCAISRVSIRADTAAA